jgi:hypothetical protein
MVKPSMVDKARHVFNKRSAKATKLLQGQENTDWDMKVSITALESEDLVAFANSTTGGTILLGVKEVGRKGELQRGEVVGCPVDDKAKRSILSKAADCTPPIAVEVFIENVKSKPFIRVEIPPGQDKPYCTKGGTYKVRGDGQNLGIMPNKLLALFVEREGESFLSRFQAATASIVRDIAALREHLMGEVYSIGQEIEQFSSSTEGWLHDIAQFAESAQTESESAGSTVDFTFDLVKQNKDTLESLAKQCIGLRLKLDAILVDRGIVDPAVRVDQELLVHLMVLSHLSGQGKEDARRIFKEIHPAGSEEQFDALYRDAIPKGGKRSD